jgi:hypothetical protein
MTSPKTTPPRIGGINRRVGLESLPLGGASVGATVAGLLLDLQRSAGNRAVVSAIEGHIALPVQRLISATEFEKATTLILREGESTADFKRFTQSLTQYEQMSKLPASQRRGVLVALQFDLKQWLDSKGKKSSRSGPVITLIKEVSAAISELDSETGGSMDGRFVYKNTDLPRGAVYKNQAQIDAQKAAPNTNAAQPTDYKNQAQIDTLKAGQKTNRPQPGTVAWLASAWAQGDDASNVATSGSERDDVASALGPTKYAKSKKRQPMYANEFTAGSHELLPILKDGENDVKAGKVASLEEYMMTQFGWDQQDCAKYLHPLVTERPLVGSLDEKGRQVFELHGLSPVTQGASPEPFDTAKMFSKFMGAGYSIYVMDKSGRIFAAQHKVGLFHHSSFLAGGSVAGAGEIKVDQGTIKSITNKSGHYQPTALEMLQVFNELQTRGISLDGLEYIHVEGKQSSKTPYPGGAAKFVKDHAGI